MCLFKIVAYMCCAAAVLIVFLVLLLEYSGDGDAITEHHHHDTKHATAHSSSSSSMWHGAVQAYQHARRIGSAAEQLREAVYETSLHDDDSQKDSSFS